MNYLTKTIKVILVILLLVAALAKVILISSSAIVLTISSTETETETETETKEVEIETVKQETVEQEVEVEVETEEEVLETVLEVNSDAEWFEQFEIDEEEIESYNLYPELELALPYELEDGTTEIYTAEYSFEHRQVGIIFDATFCPIMLDPDDGYYVRLPHYAEGEGSLMLPLENILKTMMQMNYEATV